MLQALVLAVVATSAGSTTPARPLLILSTISREGCPKGSEDDVIVCGRRDDDERYRLPLRDDRGSYSPYAGPIGDAPRATRDLFVSGPCGVFAGQRRCDKAEATAQGLGGGRDPISTTVAIVSHLLDPDH